MHNSLAVNKSKINKFSIFAVLISPQFSFYYPQKSYRTALRCDRSGTIIVSVSSAHSRYDIMYIVSALEICIYSLTNFNPICMKSNMHTVGRYYYRWTRTVVVTAAARLRAVNKSIESDWGQCSELFSRVTHKIKFRNIFRIRGSNSILSWNSISSISSAFAIQYEYCAQHTYFTTYFIIYSICGCMFEWMIYIWNKLNLVWMPRLCVPQIDECGMCNRRRRKTSVTFQIQMNVSKCEWLSVNTITRECFLPATIDFFFFAEVAI